MTLILAFACCCLAQAVVETQTQPAAPVSQEDIQRMQANLQKEIQRLRREGVKAREAAEKAALRDAEARNKIVAQNAEALKAAEARLEAIAREAQKRDDDRLRSERRIRYLVVAAVPIGIFLVWFLIRKSQKVVVVSSASKAVEKIPDILLDPDLPTMRKALAVKKEQNFIFSFRDGRRFECVGKMGADSKIVAFIKIDPDNLPIVFEKVGRRINKIVA